MKKEESGNIIHRGMTRRDFIRNSGLMLGAASLVGLPGKLLAQDAIKWKYYYYTPPLHHDTVTMRDFAKEVQQKTNNKLQITVYPGGNSRIPLQRRSTLSGIVLWTGPAVWGIL